MIVVNVTVWMTHTYPPQATLLCLPASPALAALVAPATAMPTLARFSAGASFTPSPVMPRDKARGGQGGKGAAGAVGGWLTSVIQACACTVHTVTVHVYNYNCA